MNASEIGEHIIVLIELYLTVDSGCLCVVVSKVYCSVFFMYLMYPMLPVSLDCPFLIGPSIFSNVYFIPQLGKQFIFHIFRNSFLVFLGFFLRYSDWWKRKSCCYLKTRDPTNTRRKTICL
jgi:hypothetical protein